MTLPAYRRIVAATDFSDASRLAVAAGARLARRFGATLSLVHVVDRRDASSRERATADLERLAREQALEQIEVAAIAQRSPARGILAHAEERRADLLVLGTHGRSGMDRMLAGSVAEKVVRQAPCDVLTVPPCDASRAQRPGVILAGSDFSAPSHAAVERAAWWAQQYTSAVVLAHVFDDTVPSTRRHGSDAHSKVRLEQQLLDMRRLAVAAGTPGGVEAIAAKDAAEALCRHAAAIGADLLVVARRGKSPVARLLIGSTSERVVRHAQRPVLCVRAPM